MRRRITRYAGACAALAACALLLGATRTSAPATARKRAGPGTHGCVLVVPIKGVIDRVQGAFLHRTLADASGRFDAVIFEIDTPGGRVDIMSRMSDDIIDLEPTPTIAFVTRQALSAGAFIAMSSNRIYMRSRSQIGAARGWVPDSTGLPANLPPSIDEKLASALRAQFRALAERRGYPVAIAEGMTDETVEVVKVLHNGSERYITGRELKELQDNPVEANRLRVLTTVADNRTLITFTAGEAVTHQIATKVIESLDELLEEESLSGADIIRRAPTWSDNLIAVLTVPQIVGLLILIGFGGIWLEMKMPGFGVPGTIAVVAFLVVFSSQFLVGNANAAEIMLFIVGLALLAIELFVTPGFAVLGGAGIACIFVSLLLSMQPFVVPDAPWQVHTFRVNLMATMGGVAGSLLLLMLSAWFLPGTRLFNKLTLHKELRADEGFGSGVQNGELLVGQVGVVMTHLRPAGKLEIGDKTYSVVSDAEFVQPGAKARVVRVDGPKIVVEPLEAEEPRGPKFRA